MKLTIQEKSIIDMLNKKLETDSNYLDFLGENTKSYTHGYHTYPAMMIPQLVREFIEMTSLSGLKIENIVDPFMGSGTTLVEGRVHGFNVYGNDVNPLSILMSKAKTTAINPVTLELAVQNAITTITSSIYENKNFCLKEIQLPKFKNIEFWFKQYVIEDLAIIRDYIFKMNDGDIKTFFLASFSETVRYVSNTRNNEFKLYRIAKEKLNDWNPDVLNHFIKILKQNQLGNFEFHSALADKEKQVVINHASSMELSTLFEKNKFDLLITSPPYGDSKTTVAYGQFSRLSLEWLELDCLEKTPSALDNMMLGGKVERSSDKIQMLKFLQSNTLTRIYSEIFLLDEKRANEVLQFYYDLDFTLREIDLVMKTESYQFWVVANRTVKGIKIPTDDIITELFQKYSIVNLHNFYRNIPNKRMPSVNSPTNKKGNHSSTMNKETIMFLKKTKIYNLKD
ncbi:DNA adenine methylase [Erysipelothrix rhusiopathiae]|nr:DNA adenine methylase [Erysipelothrix rhusiopathiae]